MSQSAIGADDHQWNLAFIPLLESHYVLEGRDELDGGPFISAALELDFELPVGAALIGAWFGYEDDADYREANFYAEYGIEFNSFHWAISYNHLHFYSDDNFDNELGTSLTWVPTEWLETGLEWYNSFDADGSFFQAYIASPREYGSLSFTPTIELGWNEGYRPDGHDGPNNLAVRLDVEKQIANKVFVLAYVAYTWALDKDADSHEEDEILKDFLFGGIGIKFDIP